MWSVKPHVILKHIRVVIGMGGCVFCWASTTSFSRVIIFWGDTELCCNERAHWKNAGCSQWRMNKVAVTFLLKLIFGNILHVAVSGWMSHLSLGTGGWNCQGCQKHWNVAQCRAPQNPGLPVVGTTGHLSSSHMALQSSLELQTFRARTFSPKSSPRQFPSARSSVIYQEFL